MTHSILVYHVMYEQCVFKCVCGSVCITVVEMWEREGAFPLYNGPRTPQYKHFLCPGAV